MFSARIKWAMRRVTGKRARAPGRSRSSRRARGEMNRPTIGTPAFGQLTVVRQQQMRLIARIVFDERLDQRQQRGFAAAQPDVSREKEEINRFRSRAVFP